MAAATQITAGDFSGLGNCSFLPLISQIISEQKCHAYNCADSGLGDKPKWKLLMQHVIQDFKTIKNTEKGNKRLNTLNWLHKNLGNVFIAQIGGEG